MSALGTVESSPWYRSLSRTQWQALIASNLGWTFDGFEVFSLILTVGFALRQLLDPSQYQLIPAYAGAVLAITVFGWGLGGLLGGVLADYLGRKRSMTLSGPTHQPTRRPGKATFEKLSIRITLPDRSSALRDGMVLPRKRMRV